MCVCVRSCVRACVRACVRSCVRACVRACVHLCPVCRCVRARVCPVCACVCVSVWMCPRLRMHVGARVGAHAHGAGACASERVGASVRARACVRVWCAHTFAHARAQTHACCCAPGVGFASYAETAKEKLKENAEIKRELETHQTGACECVRACMRACVQFVKCMCMSNARAHAHLSGW